MQFSKLGRTGLDVSRVCLGTMTWGRQNSEQEAHEQMDYAVTQGVNFFDTAEIYAVPPLPETYGKTEEYIGTWFAKTGKRDEIILASKIGGIGVPWIRDGEGITGDAIMPAVEDSLKRLQTDYIDLYQLHWPNRPFPHFARNHAGILDFSKENAAEIEDNLHDILRGLDEAVKAGKIRHAGLSDDTAYGIMKYLQLAEKHDLPRMQSIQNEFSLLNRSDDPYVAEVCALEDVSYLPWSPLATGMLSGKYLDGKRPEGARWNYELEDGRDLSRDTDSANDAVRQYIQVAEKHGLDVCQMALKFIDVQPFVTSTIIGATSMDQLKTDIAAFDIELSQDVLDDIDSVYRQHPIPF
jgi:aryl-alcohol dehydrogenase-like predicted oxidoreductase